MLGIKNQYRYWHLIKEIAITDFKLKYQGSVFGYLWSLAKPLAYFGVLYLVFNNVFKLGKSIPNYPIYLLVGVVIFSFFGESTSLAMNSIVSRGDLIRKVYFPRIVLVASATITSLITLCLNMLVVIGFILAAGVKLSISFLLIIPLMIELYLFIIGVSFFLSALYVKYRDIAHIWEVVNQILFYATPIVYSLVLVPTKVAKFMILSPLAQIIQDTRIYAFNFEGLTYRDYWQIPGITFIIVLAVLISGYLLFQKMAAKFAEEV